MLASVLRAYAYFPKTELLHDCQHVGFRALIGSVRSLHQLLPSRVWLWGCGRLPLFGWFLGGAGSCFLIALKTV